MKETQALDSKMDGFMKAPLELNNLTKKDVEEKIPTPEGKKDVPEERKILTYPERLKEIDVSMEDAMIIVDELIRADKYTETTKLGKDTNITLSTRSVRFTDYTTKLLDTIPLNDTGNYSQTSSKYNLAGALDVYGSQTLPKLDSNLKDSEWDNVLNVRLNFVSQLAGPVFLALINKLSKFDIKVATVMSDGYEENF